MCVPDSDISDVAIIGAGPAGLFAAFYAGLRGMTVKVLDSLDQPGGQLAALYPEKFIYDVAGFPAVMAKTLVGNLLGQAMQYEPSLVMNEQVRDLRRHDECTFELTTSAGKHFSRTVVITAGAGSFVPKTLPNVNTQPYEGRGLNYFVRDMSEYRQKRSLIVGGGDSAVDWSLNLLHMTDDITLIHRGERFRAHEDSIAKLLRGPVKVRTSCELKEIHGNGRVEAATIVDRVTGRFERIAVDAILINIGFAVSLGPIQEWGLAMDRHGISVNGRMETNIPGVYAAGDVATYPDKIKLIAIGFGEAATAVNHAKVFLDPESKASPGHSTTVVPRQRKAHGSS